MPEIAEKAQDLFEIKGVLTKFMRMLFPLEFRIDSLANGAPMLPFHYPLLPGRDDLSARAARALRHSRRRLHLLFRHHRASRGAPRIRHLQAQARRYRGLRRARRDRRRGDRQLRRVVRRSRPRGRADAAGESARIDAELRRRYRGLAPRIAGLNRSLLERLHPESLSTMLVRAALDLDATRRSARLSARADGVDPLRAGARARRRRDDQRAPGRRALQLAPGADSTGARARRRRSAHRRRSRADAQRPDQRHERLGVADRRRRRRRRTGRRAAASPTRTSRWTSRASSPRADRAGRSRPKNCASSSSRAPRSNPRRATAAPTATACT